MHIQLISGKKYYGSHGTGWVVLVNGQPHHEFNKKDAEKFIQLVKQKTS